MVSFSVIVPVYQAEKYLDKCLYSLEHQFYQNFEVIMIDDGSRDKSYSICKKYQMRDKRFRVFHQENRGVSAARNIGLQLAKNDYVLFVDADDYVSTKYLKLLSEVLKEEDICFCTKHIIVKKHKTIVNNFLYTPHSHMKDRKEIIAVLLKNQSVMQFSACSNCYRKEFLEKYHISFDSQYIVAEDLDFSLNALFHFNKATWMTEPCYFYNKNNSSSATYKVNSKGLKDSLEVWQKWYYYCIEKEGKEGKKWAKWISDIANAYLVIGAPLKRKEKKELFIKNDKSLNFYRGGSNKIKRIIFELYVIFGYENVVLVIFFLLRIKNLKNRRK